MTKITDAERDFCFYKTKRSGSFMTSLIETIFNADNENRKKLAKGFPDLVEVVDKYGSEQGYWQDLEKRFNRLYSK